MRGEEREGVRKIETVKDNSLGKLNWEGKKKEMDGAMALDEPPMQISVNQVESKDGSVKEDDRPGAQFFSG